MAATKENIDEFLATNGVQSPSEGAADTPRNVTDKPFLRSVTEMSAGFNDEVLDMINIPNDVFNWAAEKLGSERRIPSLRDTVGAPAGIGYKEGEEPDTGSYRAGTFTAQGLAFLAPFLGATRSVSTIGEVGNAIKTANVESMVTRGGDTTLVGVRNVLNRPFISSPKAALATDITSNMAAGYGSKYGEEKYGAIGGQVGGLASGMVVSSVPRNSKYLYRYATESLFPYTKEGGISKAGQVIRKVLERPTSEITAQVAKEKALALPDTKYRYSQLAGDDHLKALDKAIADADPALARDMRIQDSANRYVAKYMLREMRGDETIEEASSFLSGKYLQLSARLQARVDIALKSVQEKIADLAPSQKMSVVSRETKKQLNSALNDARKAENVLWDKVDKNIFAEADNARIAYKELLDDVTVATDPSDIPSVVKKLLGKLKKGKLKGGALKGEKQTVGALQDFRKQMLQQIRREKSEGATDWNKVRIMEEMQEALLKDIADSPAGELHKDAVDFSFALNDKFKGGIMDNIFGHYKTGGAVAPELTLDNLGSGTKGAVAINKLLRANPDIKPNIEEVLKLEIANSSIIKDGSISLPQAKRYMSRNTEIMDIFPELKRDMETAIGLQEKALWFKSSAKTRMAKAQKSSANTIQRSKPGRVLANILSAPYAEDEMKRTYRRLNQRGRAGIKNDIIDSIMDNAKTTKIGVDGMAELSGSKAQVYWAENKNVLRHAFKDNPGAIKRLENIIHNMRLTDPVPDLPMKQATDALKIKTGTVLSQVMQYAMVTEATRLGAILGKGTSGASLRTASKASRLAEDLLGSLDRKTAQQLLKDAVLDSKLYDVLLHDATKAAHTKYDIDVLQTWMLTTTVESLEDKKNE